jgi:hypothetical protein
MTAFVAPFTGATQYTQRGTDTIGAPQFDRRCVVEIGSEPAPGDLLPPRGWQAILTVNKDANDLRVKGRLLKPWAQPLAISELNIWNLSEESRSRIEGKTRIPVRVNAGYGSSLRLVGTITGVQCSSEFQDSGDVVTKIEGFNGGPRLLKNTEIKLGIGTPYADAALQLASQIGSIGASATRLIRSAGAGRVYQFGKNATGTPLDLFTRVMVDLGLEWAVVDDEVIVTEKDKTTADTFIIGPDSGLVGSPVPDSPPAPGKLRFIRAKCLMNPTFRPGSLVQLRSAIHDGFYKAWDVAHEFDTHGGDWFTSLQLKATRGAR